MTYLKNIYRLTDLKMGYTYKICLYCWTSQPSSITLETPDFFLMFPKNNKNIYSVIL